MWRMGRRRIEHELLDESTPEAARHSLADLVRLNERFGGHGLIRKLLAQLAGQDTAFTLLDVGAASGDSAKYIRSLYPHATVVSLDRNWVNASLAPQPKLLADAFHLPFRPRSFDFVFSSLFLHHFTDEQVVELLREFSNLAKQAVLVSDLERHLIPYWFLPATALIFRWDRITQHDGAISVRAAFTPQELESLAKQAGLRKAKAKAHRPAFRIGMIALPEGSALS
jgi:2-polyprenyl-3-methyl-5-hydroxy-6-metoxy-1,4-benzoquinol methylase